MTTSPARLLRPLALLALGTALALCGCGTGGAAGTGGGDPPPACGFVPGQVTTNLGSSVGGNYSTGLGFTNGRGITFRNVNLTFSEIFNGGFTASIVDIGAVCLEDATWWPGGGARNAVAVFLGHTYLVEFVSTRDGTISYAKFTTDAYDQGVLTLTYVSHL